MKSMKAAAKGAMKSMRRMKKRVSIIAKGKRAKSSVFRGTKSKTVGGLTKADLVRNKNGRVVSKKASLRAKKNFKTNGMAKWTAAVTKARKAMGIKGFQAVGGKSKRGQELLK